MAVTGSATVVIVFFSLLPSSTDFSRALSCALKSARGKSRNAAAMRNSGSVPASILAALPAVRDSIDSTAWLSRSSLRSSFFFWPPFSGCRERLGIGTLHARSKCCERAELQLFHRAFALANFLRDFLDAFFLHEAQYHDAPLFRRQSIDQPEQRGPAFDLFNLRGTGLRFGQLRIIRDFTSRLLPAVRNQIRSDAKQPRCKRNPTPFELFQIRQRVMKNLGGQVFGLGPGSYPPHHIGVHAFEMILVQLAKASGILRLCFD